MRRFQDSVRITVQLVDVETNRQIWGNTYKGKLDDIFDIQEQVASQIVEALKLKLSFSEKVSLTKRQTVNAQAYDLYLRGQDYLYRLTKRSVEYAIQLFEKAIELDPRYAAAYAACSSAYGQMYQWFSRAEQHRDKAQELSFKALMYDSNLPEAYAAMSLSYFIWGKFDEASASSRKASELDPDDSRARMYYAITPAENGFKEDAIREGGKARELIPGDPMMLHNCACLYCQLGEVDRTVETLRRAIAGGYENFGWMKHDPDLNALREHPGFIAMVDGK